MFPFDLNDEQLTNQNDLYKGLFDLEFNVRSFNNKI